MRGSCGNDSTRRIVEAWWRLGCGFATSRLRGDLLVDAEMFFDCGNALLMKFNQSSQFPFDLSEVALNLAKLCTELVAFFVTPPPMRWLAFNPTHPD